RPAHPKFREIYFYSHAVRWRERDEPIGAMLVNAGAIHPEALEHAISAQKAHQNTPIGKLLVEALSVSESDLARAVSLQKQSNHRIGDLLIEEGLASREQIERAVAEQQRRKSKRIGEVLLDMNIVSEETLARTLARKFELRFVDLDANPPNPEALREVPKEVIARYGILPIEKSGRGLVVAISDPLALEGIDELRFVADRRLEEVLATPSALKRRIDEFLRGSTAPAQIEDTEIDLVLKRLGDTPAVVEEEQSDVAGVDDPTDSAVVALVNQLIADAYRRGASDIHIEPNGKERDTMIRYRVDGECVAVQNVPARHRNAIVARIKILARLDIAERRKPQDGKLRFRLNDREIELRVATIPTVNGNEDVVMRVLAASKPIPIGELELSRRNLTELDRIIHQPYGLILCVGPTGSGKTTTLHSLLGSINTVDTKIWTAEDPVEITQPGLRQVQVNARIGLTFAQAMRAFLRADPDVIMVGEMRDTETASTGIEASLTGHLVFSTLHTNSAPETVVRLLDMGLDPFSFADALLGVLAQRLARRLCKQCKQRHAASPEDKRALLDAYGAEEYEEDFGGRDGNPPWIWIARGCDACGGSGYKGRLGLHELLIADEDIKAAIFQRSPVSELRRLARAQGMKTLAQDGIIKALRGDTDLKQVLAVCR
ncbi:MAG TPA: ATPase, T2SS/T4P/T4SS family, partial [Polyangiaceae bacterium]